MFQAPNTYADVPVYLRAEVAILVREPVTVTRDYLFKWRITGLQLAYTEPGISSLSLIVLEMQGALPTRFDMYWIIFVLEVPYRSDGPISRGSRTIISFQLFTSDFLIELFSDSGNQGVEAINFFLEVCHLA